MLTLAAKMSFPSNKFQTTSSGIQFTHMTKALALPRFLLLLFLLILVHHGWTQERLIKGIVRDSVAGEALGFATVALYNQSDSSQVGGSLADSTGSFSFEKPTNGNYLLAISFLGYAPKSISLNISGEEEVMNLGIIGLKPSQQLLDEIEITGRQSRSYNTIDRQVYDAKQFQNAIGGNATDVIRNLPGVSVNAQGGISLRGSRDFMVMLDGRQIQIDAATLLDQLPANSIEDIEVITTPSAKYDPDGKGRIIHIKTKSGLSDGFSLQVNGRLGAPSIETYDNAEAHRRFGGDITANWRQGKWNLAAMVDYRRDDIGGRRVGYVNTYLNEVLTEFPSEGERSFDNFQYSGRLSARYKPGSDHEFNLSLYAGDRTKFRTADILYRNQQRRRIAASDFQGTEAYWEAYRRQNEVSQQGEKLSELTYFNKNLRVREGDFLIGGLDYRWKVSTKTRLDLSALYERTLLGGPTDNASLAWPNISDTLQYQFNTNDNPLDGIRLKADLRKEGKKAVWEGGYQFRYLFHPGDFLYLDRDLERDTFLVNPEFTNRIELRRAIHGAYAQVSGQLKKLNYQLGLRLEYMDRRVSLDRPDTTYLYSIFQPFPSLNLSYALGQGWILKGGYSRRIQRTTTFKLTPFPEREHNETLEQGDAQLLPEFIDNLEAGIEKTFGDNRVFLTGYYREVENLINRVNTVYNDTILNRIYTNVGQGRAIGVELGNNFYPTSWWQFSLGGNLYSYAIQGDLFGDRVDTRNLIYSLNLTTDFTLAKGLTLQAAFNYLSERLTAQGVDSRFYNPSLTLQRTFGNGNFTVALQWLSIDMGLLESNEQRITTSRDNFYTTTNYIYEVDRVILTLSYRFNQQQDKPGFIKSEFGEKEF